MFDESVRSQVVLQGWTTKMSYQKGEKTFLAWLLCYQKGENTFLAWLLCISLTKGQDFKLHHGYLCIS